MKGRSCIRDALVLVLAVALGCTTESPGPQDVDTGPVDYEELCRAGTNPFVIPFDHHLAEDHLAIRTPGGDLKTMISPWAAHMGPFTGHPVDERKVNWRGLFAYRFDDPIVVDLGPCEADFELCPFGSRVLGLPLEDVDKRIPFYIAPTDGFVVTHLSLHDYQPELGKWGMYHWQVLGESCPYIYMFGHTGTLSDELRQAIVDAGYGHVLDTTAPDQHVNLIEGLRLPFAKGTPIAAPQVATYPLPDHPEYTSPDTAAAIEFRADDLRYRDMGLPEYPALDTDTQAKLQAIMEAQGTPPRAHPYASPYVREWLWRVESVLVASSGFTYGECETLFSSTGGWVEAGFEGCQPDKDPACNDQLSIFNIHTESALYDPSLYHEGTRFLIYQQKQTGGEPAYGEVVQPSELDPLAGTMVVYWRPFMAGDPTQDDPTQWKYQAMSYRVFPEAKRMVMVWGETAPTGTNPDDLPTPDLPTSPDDCNAETIICYAPWSLDPWAAH